MKVFKKVFNIFADVVIILVLLISVLVMVLSLTSQEAGVPNIFGFAPLSVMSDSMEDTIMKNDVIISEYTNDFEMKYQVGDVVTYPIKINDVKTFNTHRIVEVIEDEGITYYRTKGDNEQASPIADDDLQTSTTIVAKWTGTRIPGLGAFFSFIRTQLGFFLCVLLPMIIFFVYEAIRVILNVIAYNKAKATEEAAETVAKADLTEEQKQRAIAEYLAQQKKQAETPEQDSRSEVQTPAPNDAADPGPDPADAESDEQ